MKSLLKLTIIALCFYGNLQSLTAQWSQLTIDSDQTLYGIEYLSSGNAWIGSLDTIHYSLDHGVSFDKRGTIDVGNFNFQIVGSNNTIHAFDAGTAILTGGFVSEDESVYRTTTAGLGYEQVYTLPNVGVFNRLNDIEFRNAPLGLIVGRYGRILRSLNNGQTWNTMTQASDDLHSVTWAGGAVFLIGGDQGPLRSADAGLTWNPIIGAPPIIYVRSMDGETYGCTQTGEVWHSADQGFTWVHMGNIGSQPDAFEIVDANTLYAGNDFGIFRSTSGGAYWEVFDIPNHERIRAIDFYDDQTGIAVGSNGYAIRTTNGGGPALPMALMEVSTTSICQDETIDFTSNNDPSYNFQWLLDGNLVSTATSTQQLFTSPGEYEMQLVVNNGNGTDTTSTTIQVDPSGVTSLVYTIERDTICGNYDSDIVVSNTEYGVTYRLFFGNTQVGNNQSGNGGTRTFNTGELTGDTTFVLSARRFSSCSGDSLYAVIPITYLEWPIPDVNISLVEDSLCKPAIAEIRIEDAPSYLRFAYKLGNNSTSSYTQGNDSVLSLFTNTLTSSTSTYQVRTAVSHHQLNCGWDYVELDTLKLFRSTYAHNVRDTTIIVGQPLDFRILNHDYTNVDWDFDVGASTQYYSGNEPSGISYSNPGTYSVILDLMIGDSICYGSETAQITVIEQAPTMNLTVCDADYESGGIYVSDMHIDKFNNRYITGHRRLVNNRTFIVMKLDSLGNTVWKYFHNGSGGDTYGLGITSDSQGNVYVTVDGNVPYLPGMDLPVSDYTLLKLGPDGNPVWSMNGLAFKGIACTDTDMLYTTGYGVWNGGELLQADGSTHQITAALNDPMAGSAFLIGFNTDGIVTESITFARSTHPDSSAAGYPVNMHAGFGEPEDRGRSDPHLALTDNGNLLVSGLFESKPEPWTVSFANLTMSNNADMDDPINERQAFVAVYEPGVGFINAQIVFGGGLESVTRCHRADDGNYWFSGRLRNGITFGNNVHHYGPQGLSWHSDIFQGYLCKVDANGQVLWHVAGGGLDPYDVHGANDGSAYVLSAFRNTGQFPSASGAVAGLAAMEDTDHALLRYSATGELMSASPFNDLLHNIGYRIEADACDNLHILSVGNLEYDYTWYESNTCFSCSGNVKLRVLTATGCANNCYASYSPTGTDAALLSFELSDLTSNPGTRDIIVDLKNFSGLDINNIEFGYSLNSGPMQTFNWNGNLAFGEQLTGLAIGSENLGMAYYNFIKAWINQVNGTADDHQANDTLWTDLVVCASPLAGTYSMGQEGLDFPNFNTTRHVLETCGVSAPTVIEIVDGEYFEEWALHQIPGTNVNDTVVIRSASMDSSAVKVYPRPAQGVDYYSPLRLSGTEYLTIEHITFDAEIRGNGSTLLEIAGTSNINIWNNKFKNHSGSEHDLIGVSGSSDTHIEGNRFVRGFNGISCFGVELNENNGILVKNNFFDRQKSCGFIGGGYTSGLRIQGNTILCDEVMEPFDIASIYILGEERGAFEIIENSILRINATHSGYASMQIEHDTPGERALVANNITASPQDDYSVGLFIWTWNLGVAEGPIDIVHNTFGGSAYFDEVSDSLILFKNNIVAGSLRGVFRFVDASPDFQPVFNNNVLWANSDPSEWFIIDNYTFSHNQWTNIYGGDGQSLAQEASFVSEADLHLAPGNSFTCPAFPGITHDIDGDLRNPVSPRQGADEGDNTVHLSEEAHSSSRISVFPNPSSGPITVTGVPEDGRSIEILDVDGRLIHTIPVGQMDDEIKIGVDLSHGCYLLKLNGRNRVIDQKWIVVI